MIGPCRICCKTITGPFLYRGDQGQILCHDCVCHQTPKELSRMGTLTREPNRPQEARVWTPDDDFNEALGYMLLTERERLVVEAYYARHPGPGMLAWLTQMANLSDARLLAKHAEADTVVLDAAMGRRKAFCGKNGWGPYERRAFFAELMAARCQDAEAYVARRLDGNRRPA